MDNLVIAIALIITFAAGLAIGKTHSDMRHLRERIVALEAAQAKHLPYRTADEIENATAALNAMQFDLDFKKSLLDNALAHLLQARGGNK
jgi:hypothetical protein